MTKYFCDNCKTSFIDEQYLLDGEMCPNCHTTVLPHCEKDVPCHCAKTIHESIKFCDVCGHVVCPECGCHDVEAISRITGYLNAVEGFNNAKKQELKDRQRYTIE